MIKKIIKYSSIIVLLLIVTSCSEYQKLLKSSNYLLKYDKAIEYYKNEDYYKAKTLFEELLPLFKGTARGEKVYYHYNYCLYNEGEHIIAGYHFKNFARTFPNSEHTVESEYMAAYCQYLNSPGPSLDQSYTRKAIDELQLFINKNPESDKVEKCNDLIDELRLKLETKAYMNGKLYYDIGDYNSAFTTLKNILVKYPDTEFREEILFLIVKSTYLYAQNSIEKKKNERYQSVIKEYYALIDEYPKTKHLAQAERLFENSRKKIK